MNITALVARYPNLYHMSDKRNWENICKHGLLSTKALLDLFEYDGDSRDKIESELRRKEVCITHPVYGNSFIRDQDPMRDRPWKGIYLRDCLVGINSQDWFRMLNKKTFFWPNTTGLNFMLGATLYRDKSHYVITVDTRRLVSKYIEQVTLSSINSGSLYGMKPRSVDTFKPMSSFTEPYIREVAIEHGIPDILDFTISVDERICCFNKRNDEKSMKIIRIIYP